MLSSSFFPAFRPITFSDKPLFDRYFAAYPPEISEHTFTNIFCWSEAGHYLFQEKEGHLLRTARGSQCRLHLFPPVGPDPASFMHSMRLPCRHACWVRMPQSLRDQLHASGAKMDRDNSDYVYRLQDLRDLPGKKYDGKRNFIRRCTAEYAPVVRALTQKDGTACLAIQEQWLEHQHHSSAIEESSALTKALQHFDILGIHGIGVFIGEHLAGFAIGEPLNKTTFVEHFEKALPEYTGIYQYLLHAFAESIPSTFTYLNREQDLGIPGLRKAKESWHPDHMVEKYILPVRCGG